MLLIADEIKVAEDILKGNTNDLKHGKRLFILAKYYLHHKEYDDIKTKKLLHDYNKKTSKGIYIWEKFEPYVLKMIKNAQTVGLVKVDSLSVYEYELEIIKGLNNIVKEKVLFSMLLDAKYRANIKDNDSTWSNLDLVKIFELANCKKRKQDRDMIMNDFQKLNLVKNTKKLQLFDREILFMQSEGDIAFQITNFEDFGLQYEKLVLGNDKIVECTECGKLIEVKNGRPNQYCKECAKSKELEKYRKYNGKR